MAVLKVTVVSASSIANLDSRFAGKSDPYVVITVGTRSQHTKTVRNCVDPVWDESFDFTVEAEELVHFLLWDADLARRDTIIASAAAPLRSLQAGQAQRLHLPLCRAGPEGAASGSLVVELLADRGGQAGAEPEAGAAALHDALSALRAERSERADAAARAAVELKERRAVEEQLRADVAALAAELDRARQGKAILQQEVSRLEAQARALQAANAGDSVQGQGAPASRAVGALAQQLAAQVSQKEALLEALSEGAMLAERRQVDKLLQLSSSFTAWDSDVQLPPAEVARYLALLGPACERRIGDSVANKNVTLTLRQLRLSIEKLLKEGQH